MSPESGVLSEALRVLSDWISCGTAYHIGRIKMLPSAPCKVRTSSDAVVAHTSDNMTEVSVIGGMPDRESKPKARICPDCMLECSVHTEAIKVFI